MLIASKNSIQAESGDFMNPAKFKQQLRMQRLGINDIEQFNKLLRYAFQVTDSDLVRFGWSDEAIKHAKYPILEQAFVLGYFYKTNLISQIALYPFAMNIYNKIYNIGGITGVATYPEYSGMGLMKELMKEILQTMRNNRQSLACLYPYSIPYYRQRGFEIISDKMSFSMADTQVPHFDIAGDVAIEGMIQRVEENHKDLIALHNTFAHQTHGALIRDELAWSEYWRWDVEDIMIAIYYDSKDKPSGYLVYLLENDIFTIKEMIYISEEARRGIWNYIYAHKSMYDKVVGANFSNHSLAFLLEDGHINESITPYIMARIVDIEQFLSQYPFDRNLHKACVCFIVRDSFLEWNDKAFVLAFDTMPISIKVYNLESYERFKQENVVHMYEIRLDIQTLTTMLLGYKRPLYLKHIGRLNASARAIDVLEEILPEGKAYFSDYF